MQTLNLTVERSQFSATTTLGKLLINGAFFCHTLEDTVRVDPDPSTPQNEAKVYGETAIPEGVYDIDITFSRKFQKLMILVKDVPGFTGIRIHGGNNHLNTFGCILVGLELQGWAIKGGTSTPAIKKLFAVVDAALKSGAKVTLTVKHKEE